MVVRLSRRSMLSLAAGGLVAGGLRPALAQTPRRIELERRILEVNGRAAPVFGMRVDGSPKGLRTRFGGDFAVDVHNKLGEETLIHWHGLTPPVAQDGVPGLSAPLLADGAAQSYRFRNLRTGTHWMHSHSGLQEQQLLAAPLIVEEDGAPLVDEQEHVVMLHDFTFRDPREILAELTAGGGLHAMHGGAAKADPHAGHNMGSGHKMESGNKMESGHKMVGAPAGMHTTDIAFDAVLANDRTIDDPEIVQAEKAGRFRLRIINGAAASNMWIDLGALEGELIAVDGNSISPLRARRFPLAIAQRADIRLALPSGSGAHPVVFAVEGSDMRAAVILRSGDGAVAKLEARGAVQPPLDLSFEPLMRSIAETPDNPVARTEMVMLTGGDKGYNWGFNGTPMMHETLMRVREGERYEIMMHNMTAMAHPMHLHGHYFRVVEINGVRFKGAIRDTVLVPPDSMVSVQFDADNPGTWAFHCHHLYHMNSGMMAAISYSGAA